MDEPERLQEQIDTLRDRVSRVEAELATLRLLESRPSSRPVAQREEGKAEVALGADRPQAAPVLATARVEARGSLESRIGSQIFNRIGILALLIGAAWFLKFAIDEHWIGPAARVWIGAAAGCGLVGWSEWFRGRGYKAFSYSLKALGTGVLYLSVWAAYTLFGFLLGWVAFSLMVLITVTNAWLCWRQNSEVLAFYALAGGLLTPLLLWPSESGEATLFGYLLLLDLAVLVLASLRPWSRLVLAAFAGTAIYQVAWYVGHYTPNSLALTASFVALFFLLFSVAPQMLRNFRLASGVGELTVEDRLTVVALPLLNGLLAFAEFYALLSEPVVSGLRAWIAAAFSAFYLAMLGLARSSRMAGAPTRLTDTYLLLSVIALTGAVPLAASGRAIPVWWSVESVLLVAVARRLPIDLLRWLAGSVLGLAMLACVTINSALRGETRVVLNSRFATYFVGALAGLVVALVAADAARNAADEQSGGWRRTGLLGGIGASALVMIGVCLDIGTYWRAQLQIPRAERLIDEQFSYSAWSMAFGALLLGFGFSRKVTVLRWQGLILLALSIAKVFLVDLRELSQGYRIVSLLGLGVLLVGVSFVYQRDLLGLRSGDK